MKFAYPFMLILLVIVPAMGAFWLWMRTRTNRRLNGFVAPALQQRLMPKAPGLFTVQAVLILVGLLLIVFAAARPQWGHSGESFTVRSRNVVVALDVSRSMLAEDVRPNRLERAKSDIGDLIKSLKGDRCALVAFRRTGELLCPLTTDHGFLRSALEGVTPESAARGETDLGAAVRTALEALDPAVDEHNAIILISDGGDLRGNALDAARQAAERNIPIFTVGLGDPREGSPIPDASGVGHVVYQGNVVKSRLEEEALKAIAEKSGGKYVALATAGTADTTLGAIYTNFLRKVAQKEQAEEEQRATERFGWFLIPGVLLMLIAGMFSRGRFAGRNKRVRTVAMCVTLCLGLAQMASAEDGANRAEIVSQSSTSATNSQKVVAMKPPSDREIWNRGYDYWKAGDMTNALVTLKGLMLSRTHGARAAEIVGTIYLQERTNELAKAESASDVHAENATMEPLRRAKVAAEECAAAMQIALRATPDDARANRNFTRAVTGLQDLRDRLHVEEVLAQAKGRDPKTMLTETSRNALALLKAQQSLLTNEAAVVVAQSEALARQAADLADALIPLKRHVFETITNEQQAATIAGDIEATRDMTLQAVEQLEDISPEATESLSKAETAFHRYWKERLDPMTAFQEDFRAQTNAMLKAEQENGRDWQQEALDFTKIFGSGFPAWVQQSCAQDVSTESNKPPFTVEAAQAVMGVVQEIAKKQEEQVKGPETGKQAEILMGLNRVRERCDLISGQPPQLNALGILAQTNAYMDVKRSDGFDWQADALDATRAFRAKFPAWAQQKQQEIQERINKGETNLVQFTQEAQDEIQKLAAEVETKQLQMVKAVVPPDQEDILRKLERIRELLPKDNQNQNQQNQNQQDQNQQPNPDQRQDQNQKPPEQDQKPPEQDQKPPEQKEDQQQPEPQETKPEDSKDRDQEEIEALLRKALERSQEHDAEKKAREHKAPLPPNERDW